MASQLEERYDERIAGVLSCYDRLVVTGTLPTVCFAGGMTGFLYSAGIPIFKYPEFASMLRDRVRLAAASLAAKAELARIGRYYATESMLVLDPETGAYSANATPETGAETLFEHYTAILNGAAIVERGDHAVF